ncbi:MAG: hypothetical protein VKL39_04295 [Leptolyngbyaceae bacterium]|nr:hypothetical protein [Leptolyngbyaceae bacterium]
MPFASVAANAFSSQGEQPSIVDASNLDVRHNDVQYKNDASFFGVKQTCDIVNNPSSCDDG